MTQTKIELPEVGTCDALIASFADMESSAMYVKCVVINEHFKHESNPSYTVWGAIGMRDYNYSEYGQYNIAASTTDYVIYYSVSEEEMTLLKLMFTVITAEGTVYGS